MEIALSSLYRAFEAVKKNNGCAGVDGVTIRQFEKELDLNLRVLQDKLYRNIYAPLPLMKLLVPKNDGGKRILCIPTVCDRVAHKAVQKIIEPILEKEFEDSSYAYRKGRSVKQAVFKIREYYKKGYHWVVDADIDDFFNSVDHDILMEKTRKLINNPEITELIRLWIKNEIWDGETLDVPENGIPQGSSVSPVLANLFLDEMDEAIAKKGYKYIRYADDFLILGKNKAEAENGLELSRDILERLELDLGDDDITTFQKGFRYLGVFFLNDFMMKPFNPDPKEKKQVIFPKPLDMKYYLAEKSGLF